MIVAWIRSSTRSATHRWTACAAARRRTVRAGISTGANVVGAYRLAERLGPDAVIVTLAVDTGFKYMSVSPYADT
jgi:cysteine synthase